MYSSSPKVVRIRIRAVLSVAMIRRGAWGPWGAGLGPVERGHADFHQYHGRVKPPRHGHSFQSVACFGDDFHVLFAGEQHSEAGADHGLVVGDEDSDSHGRSGASGRRVLSVTPPSFVVPAVISPP